MAEDSKLSAVLETYAEDATEYNDDGSIVWVESSNPDIAAFVNFLLKTLCIDKNIYKWTYSLCKYGDLYLRLYRKSEYNDLLFDVKPKADDRLTQKLEEALDENISSEKINGKKQERLDETLKIKAYAKSDRYVNYIEMVDNPAEVFELTRFGKTAGYIQTKVPYMQTPMNDLQMLQGTGYFRYKFRQGEINLFPATEFVHACLEDNTSRMPEEVDIFVNSGDADSNSSDMSMSYKVKRGQSVLASAYKVWRELDLLEASVLLSRVTQSSIVRIIQVEVGDMPKESVGPHLQGVKNMIEQKAAISVGNNMTEYTNPGPIINNIYNPTHGGVGAITVQTLGEQYDPKSLVDLDYYMNNLYGTLRVPKQYFNQTDDATGFNGGTSLSIISSRYAKMIKRIQKTMIQVLTDAVNLMLLDAGLGNYINNFTIHMLPPTTQEEKDRRENLSTRIQLIRDIMDLLSDLEDPVIKLKILKSRLSNALQDQELTELLQDAIESVEKDLKKQEQEEAKVVTDDSEDVGSSGGESFSADEPLNLDFSDANIGSAESVPEESSDTLPTPSDLGIDVTDSSNF